uniref:RING-type E3 ubiquitin transferase n=1 Tax=Anser cygnoides TaxID=8845 RepID=A0A8B9EJR5_ANSCY
QDEGKHFVESMATALDTRCPICLDSWVNPSFVVPCLHRFCFECIQRWAESKPECPLCKRRVSSIVTPGVSALMQKRAVHTLPSTSW